MTYFLQEQWNWKRQREYHQQWQIIQIKRQTKLQWQEHLITHNESFIKKRDRRNLIIRNDDDDVDVTETLLMITMQARSKMRLQIYKQNMRQNPVKKNKLKIWWVMTNRSKRPITLMYQMMTLMQKVKNMGKGYLMKIRRPTSGRRNRWWSCGRATRLSEPRETMREKTHKA